MTVPAQALQKPKLSRADYDRARAGGYTDEEIRAEFDVEEGPSLPAAAPAESSQYTGRTPEEFKAAGAPLPAEIQALKAVVPMIVGGGVGGATAKGLAGLAARGLAGRVATGALSGLAGGAAARGASVDTKDVPERLKSMFTPSLAMAVDAVLGGAGGALAGITPKASRVTAHEVGEKIPNVVRKGVPNEVAQITGTSTTEPGVVQRQMTNALNQADEARFAFLQNGGGDVADPAILQQYNKLRAAYPELEAMLENKATLKDLRGAPVNFGTADKPTLQRLHYFKQLLRKPETLLEARAAAGKPLAKEDLADLKAVYRDFRDMLTASSPEYAAAVKPSELDRRAIAAVEKGTKIAKPSVRSLGKNANTPGTVTEDVLSAAQAQNPQELDAIRKGFIGELALQKDPLNTLRGPSSGPLRDRLRALLGEQPVRQIDEAINPWENLQELGGKLRNSGMGLAAQFGAAGALGGNVGAAKTATGSQILNTVLRGYRLNQARNAIPMMASGASGPDTQDIIALLQELAKLKAGRTAATSAAAGALSGTYNR